MHWHADRLSEGIDAFERTRRGEDVELFDQIFTDINASNVFGAITTKDDAKREFRGQLRLTF